MGGVGVQTNNPFFARSHPFSNYGYGVVQRIKILTGNLLLFVFAFRLSFLPLPSVKVMAKNNHK